MLFLKNHQLQRWMQFLYTVHKMQYIYSPSLFEICIVIFVYTGFFLLCERLWLHVHSGTAHNENKSVGNLYIFYPLCYVPGDFCIWSEVLISGWLRCAGENSTHLLLLVNQDRAKQHVWYSWMRRQSPARMRPGFTGLQNQSFKIMGNYRLYGGGGVSRCKTH